MSEIDNQIKTAQINQALGVFILVFGLIVSFAMIFTETTIQLITDLIAGLLMISIGGAMFWRAKKTLKKLRD